MEHQPLTSTMRPRAGSDAVRREPGVVLPALGWRSALPTLIGHRVRLRELGGADAAHLAPLLSAPEVARFISPPPGTAEQFAWFIERSCREREAGRYAVFGVVPAADPLAVGLIQIRRLDPQFHTAEWGFALGSHYWGQGLFLDAARLLLDFAFLTLGVRRLEARVAVPNARAHAVLSKLGAVQEGVLRQSLVTGDGQPLDQVLWSLLASEWRRVASRADAHVH